jgi:dimethylhistidine N-methyltransferase
MLELADAKTRQTDDFRADVLAGLARRQKTLPSRWLYDARGCELFEAITRLEEYYPTRTEIAILNEYASQIAAFCGGNAVFLEYGAGAGIKTEIVLDALETPQLYIPIDIAADFLEQTAARVRSRFSQLKVHPIGIDFTTNFDVPSHVPSENRVAFFPGSTIGNLDTAEALAFLRRVRGHVGSRGRAIIGVDQKKDIPTLIAAYDDRQRVTAAFNLNLLARINRELLGDFRLNCFVHQARWNVAESAVEMHLVSLKQQAATVAGQRFSFWPDETIHTESSRKYSMRSFSWLVVQSGWRVDAIWTDPRQRFALFGLCVA